MIFNIALPTSGERSMAQQMPSIRSMRLSRGGYFIAAALLILLVGLFRVPFFFPLSLIGAVGWLFIYWARIQDIERPIWFAPMLILVVSWTFFGEIFRYIEYNIGTKVSLYFVFGWVVVFAGLTVVLGLQRGTAQATKNEPV